MPFSALATKIYKDPLTLQWGNTVKANDDQLYMQVSKAWIVFDGSAPTIIKDFNVDTVVKTAAGLYQINFTSGFSSTSYCIVGNSIPVGNTPTNFNCRSGTDADGNGIALTGSVLIEVHHEGNTPQPSNRIYMVVFGDNG